MPISPCLAVDFCINLIPSPTTTPLIYLSKGLNSISYFLEVLCSSCSILNEGLALASISQGLAFWSSKMSNPITWKHLESLFLNAFLWLYNINGYIEVTNLTIISFISSLIYSTSNPNFYIDFNTEVKVLLEAVFSSNILQSS